MCCWVHWTHLHSDTLFVHVIGCCKMAGPMCKGKTVIHGGCASYTHGSSSPNPLHVTLDPRSCLGKDWENKLEVTEGSEWGRELENEARLRASRGSPLFLLGQAHTAVTSKAGRGGGPQGRICQPAAWVPTNPHDWLLGAGCFFSPASLPVQDSIERM